MNEDFDGWWKANGSDNWAGKRWARAAWEDRQDEINTLKAENEKLREAAGKVLNTIYEKNLYSAPLPRTFWDAFDNLNAALEKKQ